VHFCLLRNQPDQPGVSRCNYGGALQGDFPGAYISTYWRPKWLKEDFHGWVVAGKAAATLLVGVGLVWLIAER
jgi:hypothetical protein